MSAREQGKLYFQKGKFSAAADAYTEAITLEPSEAALYQNRALCYQKLSRWQNVFEDASKATELEKGSVKAHYLIGNALCELDKLDEAEKAFETALTLSNSPQFSSYRGSIEAGLYGVKSRRQDKEREREEKEEEEDRSLVEALVCEAAQRGMEKAEGEEDEKEAEAIQYGMLEKVGELAQRAATAKARPAVPECLCCQITFDLLKEPVLTPSGQTYEREALEQHIAANGRWDPVTRQPFQAGDLRENTAVKELIRDFLEQNPWAFNA